MNSRRVVVTGTGIVSPIGSTTKEFWKSIVDCRSGIGPYTSVNPENIRFKHGAEVKDFDPTIHIEKGALDLMDRFAQFAVVAAQQAVKQAGITFTSESAQRTEVFMPRNNHIMISIRRIKAAFIHFPFQRPCPIVLPATSACNLA
jgi:3-oxoacyl-(acyl-carrier-protein) synthase